jgi:hypothetical protein
MASPQQPAADGIGKIMSSNMVRAVFSYDPVFIRRALHEACSCDASTANLILEKYKDTPRTRTPKSRRYPFRISKESTSVLMRNAKTRLAVAWESVHC